MRTLSRIFSALADPTRRAILAELTTGTKTVTEIAEPFDIYEESFDRLDEYLEDLQSRE